MPISDALREALATLPTPECAKLTPFEVTDADESGRVRVRFSRQPAFGNHFGNVQGGFLIAMLEVPLTLAIFACSRRWYPTIEIKASFVAPAPLGDLHAEAVVLRLGKSICFSEARMWTPDDTLVAHATASSLVTRDR